MIKSNNKIPKCLKLLAAKGELFGAIDLSVHKEKNIGIALIGCESVVKQFIIDQKDALLDCKQLDENGFCIGCFYCTAGE